MFLSKGTVTIVIVGICLIIKSTQSVNMIPSAAPSVKELQALQKFKELVKGIVYLDYQKTDSFLLCWIRGSALNLELAKSRLSKSMTWRKEKQIDALLNNPEMQKMEKIFRFSVDTVDRHGHPVVNFGPGRWDIRKMALSGKVNEFQLFWIYMYETAMKKSRELNEASGKDMSEFILLLDASGFNIRMQGCLVCLAVLGRVTTDFDNHYSAFAHSLILANAPRAIDIVLDFTRPLMSPGTRKAITVLTSDPQELKDFFTNLIDDDQLGRQFGGKRNMNGKGR